MKTLNLKKLSLIAISIVILISATISVYFLTKNHASAEEETPELPVLKVGRYYLNGDKSTDFYIEVFENSEIELFHPDLFDYFYQYSVKDIPTPYLKEGQTEEEFYTRASNTMVDMFDGRMSYEIIYQELNKDTLPFSIITTSIYHDRFVHSYKYVDENTIKLAFHGDFIYVS